MLRFKFDESFRDESSEDEDDTRSDEECGQSKLLIDLKLVHKECDEHAAEGGDKADSETHGGGEPFRKFEVDVKRGEVDDGGTLPGQDQTLDMIW